MFQNLGSSFEHYHGMATVQNETREFLEALICMTINEWEHLPFMITLSLIQDGKKMMKMIQENTCQLLNSTPTFWLAKFARLPFLTHL